MILFILFIIMYNLSILQAPLDPYINLGIESMRMSVTGESTRNSPTEMQELRERPHLTDTLIQKKQQLTELEKELAEMKKITQEAYLREINRRSKQATIRETIQCMCEQIRELYKKNQL